MFGIFASISIKSGLHDQFLSTIRDTAHKSVTEEAGCVRFDVFKDLANENRYVLYEVYTDEAAFETHLKTAHAKRAMEGTKTWAESPFEVTRAESIHPEHPRAFETVHRVE